LEIVRKTRHFEKVKLRAGVLVEAHKIHMKILICSSSSLPLLGSIERLMLVCSGLVSALNENNERETIYVDGLREPATSIRHCRAAARDLHGNRE
jgi:hypothetical protein